MSYEHMMVDIETLDTAPSAVVLSIGAVKFNADGIGERFYVKLNHEAQLYRTTSQATRTWWDNQSEEARDAAFGGERTSVSEALQQLAAFFDHDDYKVWGNGVAFDNVILTHLFNQYDMPLPWKYYNDRCFRTLRAIVYDNFPFLKNDQVKPTVAHNALADAEAQALDLLRLEGRTQIVLNVDMSNHHQVTEFAEGV